MTKTTVTYGVLVMALCLVLVRRHTRVEEESGRASCSVPWRRTGRPAAQRGPVGVIQLLVAVVAALADIAGTAGRRVPGSRVLARPGLAAPGSVPPSSPAAPVASPPAPSSLLLRASATPRLLVELAVAVRVVARSGLVRPGLGSCSWLSPLPRRCRRPCAPPRPGG